MKNLAVLLAAATGVVLSPAPRCAAEQVDGLQAELARALDYVNAALDSAGSTRRYLKAEALLAEEAYLAAGASPMTSYVIAKDTGNKRLIGINGPEHFVPRDPRRAGWSSTGDTEEQDSITYASAHLLGASWPFRFDAEQDEAIAAAMRTWDAVTCADLPVVNSAQPVTFPYDLPPGADIEHAGQLSFHAIGIPTEAGVIALTLTAYFTDPAGKPTDIDGNGMADVMSRLIIYNSDWLEFPGVDFPTIALHEAGHGLSQGHFGKVWLEGQNLQAAPSAAMNAAYTGPRTALSGVDTGGHCSIWASWPHR